MNDLVILFKAAPVIPIAPEILDQEFFLGAMVEHNEPMRRGVVDPLLQFAVYASVPPAVAAGNNRATFIETSVKLKKELV